jgi:hypothetical protein
VFLLEFVESAGADSILNGETLRDKIKGRMILDVEDSEEMGEDSFGIKAFSGNSPGMDFSANAVPQRCEIIAVFWRSKG